MICCWSDLYYKRLWKLNIHSHSPYDIFNIWHLLKHKLMNIRSYYVDMHCTIMVENYTCVSLIYVVIGLVNIQPTQ